jgi:RNA polymerase sigma-70 factor (ECF subfamily)
MLRDSSFNEITRRQLSDEEDSMAQAVDLKSRTTNAFASELAICGDSLSESELVERAKCEPEMFGRLYEANYITILNYIYRRTLNVEVAEDLTSNTFFKALRALPRFRLHVSFRAWLYRIATNEVRKFQRSARRRKRAEENLCWEIELKRVNFASNEEMDVPDREERMWQHALLNKSFATLPGRYQTVLSLRYFENLRYTEIAEAMGKRVGTVKSMVHRGLKRLRTRMKKKSATFSQ